MAVHASTSAMHQVYKIASNLATARFYLNHSYLYPYGNSPAIDLTGGCQTKCDVDFLLLGCGDIRNILFTIKTLDDEKSKSKNLHFFLNDIEGVILARNLVLLRILEIIDPSKDDDVEFLWSVWYDAAIPKECLIRLKVIIQDLLQNLSSTVEYVTEETEEELKSILKYWLIGNITHEDVKRSRLRVLHERLEKSKMMEKNIIPPHIYKKDQVSTWREEVVKFVESGSTYKDVSGDFGANPTLICPRVAGWRVHPDGTPFHSYNLNGLIEGHSLFYNCLSQLKMMVCAWQRLRTRNNSKITVSLCLENCLTLCNNFSLSDGKFDFIHTSNLADHVGLLNLLVACSGLLKRSGLLTMEIMHWNEFFNSMEDYLQQICVPSSYFPTVFGLRLAEDFKMGTSTPRSLRGHIDSINLTVRWLDAGKAAERIDINGSPQLLAVFRGLVKESKALLEIIKNSQPGLKTKSGHVFYPHEDCFRAVWMSYRDQLGCDWPGGPEEQGLLMLKIDIKPNRTVGFSKERLQIGKISRNFADSLINPHREFPPNEPWFFVTTMAYNMDGSIKVLLPVNVWDSLEHSSILELHGATGRADQLFVPIAIKKYPAVKTVERLIIASKAVTEEEKPTQLKVTEYKDKYEIHMKWHESLGEFPYLKVERGPDPTELLIDSKSSSSTCRLRCPVLDIQTIPSLSDNSWTITAKKDLNALHGPFILKYRRLDIQRYPTERKSTCQFDGIISNNFSHESGKRMAVDSNDALFNVTQYVLDILEDTKVKPPEQPNLTAYFITVKERNPNQSFGDVSEDIFIFIHKCHLINEILSVDIDWIDFEKVNLYNKTGKLSKREVDVYCQKHGLLSFGKKCELEVTQKEAILLRKWLILNTMKSKQRHRDQTDHQWLFNSFLQPVFTINNNYLDQEQMKALTD
ncbi:hypothetical protein CHS0354_004870 [Potamilus streckersoni]|uniref:DUF4470 domain-containing protein n=1 Tax=Potamilus streckersoni TaxID=2493646 RepID=A0AAE0S970_9BIVA|nr:hypothetical protein CHS0354_004870 [Potamilus streckersoni]